MKGKIIRSTGRGSEEGARRKKHKVSLCKLLLSKMLREVNDNKKIEPILCICLKQQQLGSRCLVKLNRLS